MKALYLLPCLLLFSIACNSSRKDSDTLEVEPATVILVRHAEKAFGEDPDLTPEGTARANLLADMLSNTELDAVYSTDTQRTLQTARPTADSHSLKVDLYDAAELQVLSNRLARKHRGETILIVGHSNTTPAMANYLADTDALPRFNELDYGNLLIVTLPESGKARVLQLRY